jgi:hypothetical protein
MEQWQNDDYLGELQKCWENLVQSLTMSLIWNCLGLNLRLCSENPVSSCLSHGTVPGWYHAWLLNVSVPNAVQNLKIWNSVIMYSFLCCNTSVMSGELCLAACVWVACSVLVYQLPASQWNRKWDGRGGIGSSQTLSSAKHPDFSRWVSQWVSSFKPLACSFILSKRQVNIQI